MNDGHNVDEMLRQMQAQQQAEQQMAMLLNRAINQPHTITHMALTAVGMRDEGDAKVLMIGSPDGSRIDVPLNGRMVATLGRALAAGLLEKFGDGA